MYKLKSNKSVLKRVKVTGTGKVVRRKAGLSHLLSTKNSKCHRRLRQKVTANRWQMQLVKMLLAGHKA